MKRCQTAISKARNIGWLKWILPLLFLLPAACSQVTEQQQLWALYKSHFLDADGSIVDAVNGNIRHSEGQGMGMLLATANQDRESFDRIWDWTKVHLQVREDDALLVWRWQPTVPHISDVNNATDGDLLIAWSLIRAYHLWHDEQYQSAATKLLKDVRHYLITYQHGRMLLLPGKFGFIKEDGTIVNLSYWVFPALKVFQQFEPDQSAWPGLIQSGLKLADESLFGAWKLSPDWLMVNDTVYPALQFPKHFGLDAVRIPLYLKWGGYNNHSASNSAAHFWAQFTGESAFPEWAGLDTTDVHMADNVSGVLAVAAFIQADEQQSITAEIEMSWDQPEYYQATLLLITKLAEQESML